MIETTTVLTLPDAERLAERTLATIHPDPGHYDDNEDRWQREVNTRHGMYKHPGYHSWKNMIARTTPGGSAQQNRPGYIGVGRHPAWSTFDGFWLTLGATWFAGAVLGRYGDEGDYTPTNCRWITKAENNREKAGASVQDTAALYGVTDV